MKEEDIVIQLLTLEKKLSQLNLKKEKGLGDPSCSSAEKLEKEVQSLKKRLETFSNDRYSIDIRAYMNVQITEYINAFSELNPEVRRIPLSKNQMLGHSDFVFFSGFLKDLKKMLTYHYFCINIPLPANLIAAKCPNDAIDINDLIDFLEEERRNLNCLENINFIKLRIYIQEVETRIKKRFY